MNELQFPGGDNAKASPSRLTTSSTAEASAEREEKGLWSLRADLSRARSEDAAGLSAKAKETILQSLKSLKQPIEQISTADSKFVQRALLYARANAILGLVCRHLGQDIEANSAYQEAVTWFDQWMPKTREPDNQTFNECGLALHAVGRTEEAIPLLEKAAKTGVATAESYYCLGLYSRELQNEEMAEQYLRQALKLTPDDPKFLQAFAETLVGQGPARYEEALSLYQASALRFNNLERYDEALTNLDNALLLYPYDLTLLNEKADVLRVLSRYAEAAELLDKALAIAPEDDRTLANKGETLRMLGRDEEALQALDQALAQNPSYAFALANKGETLRMLGRYEEALQALERALEQKPTDAFALATKGAALRMLGRYEEALQMLDQALAQNPANAFALTNKGETLRMLGRDEEALQALDQALAQNPSYAFALANKGETLRMLGRYEEALQALERALEQKPTDAFALATKGATLRMLERYEEALQMLDQALAQNPANAFALTNKGETLRMLGRDEEALQALDQALAQNPAYAFALATKGETLRMLGRADEALQVLDQALAQNPTYAFALATKGAALRMLGRYKEALQVLDQALAQNPTDAFALTNKGETLRMLERYEEALQVLDQALAQDPTDTFALTNKGYALGALKRYEESVATFQSLLKRERSAWNLANVAWALQIKDEFTQALEVVKEALALDPDDAWVLSVNGSILLQTADYAAAVLVLTRAVQLDSHDAWLIASKGFALKELGAEHLLEARQACELAIQLEPTKLRWHTVLGDILYKMGEDSKEQALEIYKWVIQEVTGRTPIDLDGLELAGWCHYRLGHWDEAERHFIEAVSASSDLPNSVNVISLRFRLALAEMCGGRHELAHKEYQRCLELLKSKDILAQRGLVWDAMNDLQNVLKIQPDLAQVDEVKAVQTMLQENGNPLAKFPH